MDGATLTDTSRTRRKRSGIHCQSGTGRSPRGRPRQSTKIINLALQGGGAHGAFAWGVLDRLLDDDRIGFDGISATSAGAMNAVVLAYGLTVGGRDGAKRALAGLWRRISHTAVFSPLQPMPVDRMGNWRRDYSSALLLFDWMTKLLSPYRFNLANFNPLRDILMQLVDFEVLRPRSCPVKLFLSATNVRTGKIKVFDNTELGVDAVLASACVPYLFQAVEIDGDAYWDGGYMGNPAIFPLIYNCGSRDIVIVHVNPLNRAEVPRSATEILDRVNEISFNCSLVREMRAISFVTKLIDDGLTKAGALKRIRVHSISDEEGMSGLGVASKLNADWAFLTELRDRGRDCAEAWIAANFGSLGQKSTVDIGAMYL